jgi:phospholipase/carboxylesterase
MLTILDSSRKASRSGEDTSLVIFLHGYGADGTDLLGLSEPLSELLPDTVFVSPNAPERCSTNPGGFQWFPIPWIDGSSEEEAELGLNAAERDLNAYIDQVMEQEGLSDSETVLIGFSQGTMMALHVAPRRKDEFACVVGFSGRLLKPELLADEVKSRPPVLLLHGDRDEVVPFSSMSEASEMLMESGFESYTHIMEDMGHGISPDGLEAALTIITDKLG